jgi:hypothetical protein
MAKSAQHTYATFLPHLFIPPVPSGRILNPVLETRILQASALNRIFNPVLQNRVL